MPAKNGIKAKRHWCPKSVLNRSQRPRGTAKVLMKWAGVSRDISERCLAHVIGGVAGTYDRYNYLREKQEAFDRRAALVERIVNPPSDVVVNMRPRRRERAR
jgi:hypothetical protein